MSGSTFKGQKIITESILTESPELIESIISNPEVRKYNEEFWKDLNMLSALAQDKKTDEIQNYIRASQEKISKNIDLNKSYKKLSSMIG